MFYVAQSEKAAGLGEADLLLTLWIRMIDGNEVMILSCIKRLYISRQESDSFLDNSHYPTLPW